ncbi:hypothetical protein [Terriglobus aquaticus]|uniref:hypothetical protein n=1 Tax=Terriglobus aquaticus TaxID=940139 RepID=UPI0031DA6C9E
MREHERVEREKQQPHQACAGTKETSAREEHQQRQREREQGAHKPSRDKQAVAAVLKKKGPALQEGAQFARVAFRGRHRRVEPYQRQCRQHFHQGWNFGVRSVVALGQNPVTVIKVVCLIPIG